MSFDPYGHQYYIYDSMTGCVSFRLRARPRGRAAWQSRRRLYMMLVFLVVSCEVAFCGLLSDYFVHPNSMALQADASLAAVIVALLVYGGVRIDYLRGALQRDRFISNYWHLHIGTHPLLVLWATSMALLSSGVWVAKYTLLQAASCDVWRMIGATHRLSAAMLCWLLLLLPLNLMLVHVHRFNTTAMLSERYYRTMHEARRRFIDSTIRRLGPFPREEDDDDEETSIDQTDYRQGAR